MSSSSWPVLPLQCVVAVAGLVPVAAGLGGMWLGPAMAGGLPGDAALDSHFRYLSGLLLGVGLAFWCLIPGIATRGAAFRGLTAIVVLGGLGRALGFALNGMPPGGMLLALAMELLVTPLLCLWQARVARR
jgi:hypothetical protein